MSEEDNFNRSVTSSVWGRAVESGWVFCNFNACSIFAQSVIDYSDQPMAAVVISFPPSNTLSFDNHTIIFHSFFLYTFFLYFLPLLYRSNLTKNKSQLDITVNNHKRPATGGAMPLQAASPMPTLTPIGMRPSTRSMGWISRRNYCGGYMPMGSKNPRPFNSVLLSLPCWDGI